MPRKINKNDGYRKLLFAFFVIFLERIFYLRKYRQRRNKKCVTQIMLVFSFKEFASCFCLVTCIKEFSAQLFWWKYFNKWELFLVVLKIWNISLIKWEKKIDNHNNLNQTKLWRSSLSFAKKCYHGLFYENMDKNMYLGSSSHSGIQDFFILVQWRYFLH